MAKSCNQKLKILYLMELLNKRGQEKKTVSMQEIIDFLSEKGIQAERKSIYDDMEALRSYGLDIRYNRKRPGGYYLLSELPGIGIPAGEEPPKAPSLERGDKKRLKLLCEKSVQNLVEEQLGEPVSVKEKDEQYVVLTMEQPVDAIFFGWLVSMGRQVKLVKPKKVSAGFRDYLRGIVKEYKE